MRQHIKNIAFKFLTTNYGNTTNTQLKTLCPSPTQTQTHLTTHQAMILENRINSGLYNL